MMTLPGEFLKRFMFSDRIIYNIGTCSQVMLSPIERKLQERLRNVYEMQYCKSSNIEFEI